MRQAIGIAATIASTVRPIAMVLPPVLIAVPALAEPPRYGLDPMHSTIAARVAFFGIASKTAHFPRAQGSIRLPAPGASAMNLEVVLDARELTAGDPVTLARLKGPDFFDVARFPEVRFAGDSLRFTTPVTAIVHGTVTAHGVTRPTDLTVSFMRPPQSLVGGEPIVLSARATIDRTAFGMTAWPFIVGRKVTITINATMVAEG